MTHRYALLASFLAPAFLLAQNLVSIERGGGISQALVTAAKDSIGIPELEPRYGFDYYFVTYTMENLAGELDTVGGLLSIPNGSNAEGQRFPRLISQHFTPQTALDAPTSFTINLSNFGESQIDLSVLYATQGYVTLAPDFLNMGLDDDGFHPYVHAETEALAAVRMLQALESDTLYAGLVNEQLFATGYSQGGHASMALHELLIEDADLAADFALTAAAHQSGPYSISEVMRNEVILADSTYFFVGFVPFTILSYQAAYPELEQDLTALFRPQYVPLIERFRDEWQAGTYPLGEFTVDLAERLAISRAPDIVIYPYELFTAEFEAELRGEGDSDWLAALRDNDTYDFDNPTPTRLYYCRGDEVVTYRNALVAADSLLARGATNTEAVRLDTDAEPLGHQACAPEAILATIEYFGGFQRIDELLIGTRDEIPGTVTWVQAGRDLRVDTDESSVRYTLGVYDALGREVVSVPDYRSGSVVDLGALGAGFAVARLTDAEGRTAARALILR